MTKNIKFVITRFVFSSSKCTKICFQPRLCPGPHGELTMLPRSPSRLGMGYTPIPLPHSPPSSMPLASWNIADSQWRWSIFRWSARWLENSQCNTAEMARCHYSLRPEVETIDSDTPDWLNGYWTVSQFLMLIGLFLFSFFSVLLNTLFLTFSSFSSSAIIDSWSVYWFLVAEAL